MTSRLHFSLFTTLLILLLVAPSYALAQLPPTTRSHPTVAPPTKAPTAPLPATPLPGSPKVSTSSPATTNGPVTPTAQPEDVVSFGTTPYMFIALGVLVLIGIGGFLFSRRNSAIQAGTPEV